LLVPKEILKVEMVVWGGWLGSMFVWVGGGGGGRTHVCAEK